MGKFSTLRDLLGLIKDAVALSKAAILSNPNALTLRLAVLRATTHSPPTPPDNHHLSALLLLGDSSRATASIIITALIDRLHCTGNCVVTLKCLLIIHNIIKRGPFILQDQLSIFPATGGYNYLKLSDFRDGATAATWALSQWVRFYGRYLETLLSTSRDMGYFLCSSSCTMVTENQEQRILSLLNVDLIKDVDSLIQLIEELCKVPDFILIEGNIIVKDIIRLLLNDYVSVVNEIALRLYELKERLSCLSFGDSVELLCALKRLEDCKESILSLYVMRKPAIELMWSLVQDLKEGIGKLHVCKNGEKLVSFDRRMKGSESARFVRESLQDW
ncbi:hypothetical protein CDL12_18631 [Handroanthus impetiginosus]|uniref:ENTH domain-containing protein n=1 Tax=Handroanthus impetiginosus TaxID=429701 RepID=A0A2G9GUU8_9LAMI|nr:hypothetical protein CDL12_18631 [Handroanthus impetiginosus]